MTTLLVVDDEQAFGRFVVKVAVAAGYQAVAADTVPAFWRAVEVAWPTILLLDLQMPDMDGIQLLRELGQRRCTSKVVLASGMDARVLDSAHRLGGELGLAMAGTIQKPVRAADLRHFLTGLANRGGDPTAEALSSAIENGRMFLLYQPQVDLRTRRMEGVEALVRWRAEHDRVIPPDAFIPLAEESGLIGRLTDWVVDAAFAQAGVWRRKGLTLRMGINLSAKNIQDRQLPDRLAARCRVEDIPPERITLELTESATNDDCAALLEILSRFRVKGFQLSTDDFGTGYSSVAQLLRLPFSELKVDKSFVMGVGRSHDSTIIAKTLIDMARNLNLSTVAEGVETETVFQTLAQWGCDLGQGYLFSRPVTAAEIEARAAMDDRGS
jgi:EAL domain-containing protein (putative c-di-GMP-specific phosphodiesterase class I)